MDNNKTSELLKNAEVAIQTLIIEAARTGTEFTLNVSKLGVVENVPDWEKADREARAAGFEYSPNDQLAMNEYMQFVHGVITSKTINYSSPSGAWIPDCVIEFQPGAGLATEDYWESSSAHC